ncbi:MAG: protein meaA [Actinomycetia bacterium]|nr:protein meaA [Actinomycetes bacterium]
MRTYAGHSSAKESNQLFQTNLAKGQTGLSIAFDLPTQTGYDPEDLMSRGEVGKVGVSIASLADMRTLFEGIPLERMNTSMTINATAVWLYSMYLALADEQDVPRELLTGTTQNDIIKEYLSRGTYAFPPAPSLEIATDLVAFSVVNTPKWNPINICSYHLQEAGATAVQEVAFALASAISVLDSVKAKVEKNHIDVNFDQVVARMSFFVNGSIRFIEEVCKLKAFGRLWSDLVTTRYGVTTDSARRFRYGVQVNSLGLTEEQPENNVQRIVLEMLGVSLAKDSRARAIQLPAWNEALGLPRPWDQQWSLRMQQVLALETDLLEYEDIFEGSIVIETKVAELMGEIRTELDRILEMGGVIPALESGYLKSALVASHARRRARIESGDLPVVGVNIFETSEVSPLSQSANILVVDPNIEERRVEEVLAFKAERDSELVRAALQTLDLAAESGVNLVEASISAAKVGVTTGEWSSVLRARLGEYRSPTGVVDSVTTRTPEIELVRSRVEEFVQLRGHRPRLLIGKPGLDGHSNGAEQIAVRARDCGFEVIYQGIRLRPEDIVAAAIAEDVDVIGLSILSGSHKTLVAEILDLLSLEKASDIPVIVGGIIPEEDAKWLESIGVAATFTPKDFKTTQIMNSIVEILNA